MALNTDFKVKDSLYVGNSACFVTQTDTPKILSAGTELFDIFLQEGEIAAQCSLTNGTAIGTLDYDGSSDTTISIDSTCNTTWNSAYTTTQANSANWNSAYTWCTTNGDNVIDTVAEGNAQGKVAVTNIANATTQVDVNGLQTDDSPQFTNICMTGNVLVDGTVDGRDIANDGTTLDTLQSLSGDNSLTFSSPSQGTLRVTEADGDTTDVDLGVQSTDNVGFATICATGNLNIDGSVDGRDVALDGTTTDTLRGLSGANVTTGSSTAQGTVRLTQADGTNIDIDTGLQDTDSPTFNGACFSGAVTTSSTIDGRDIAADAAQLAILQGLSGGNVTDVSGSATQGRIVETVGSGATTNIDLANLGATGTPTFGGVTVEGGLSATTLSGDGSAITNIDVDAVAFPSTDKSDITATDEFWVNDGTNKKVTYSNLLTDLAGTNMGLEVDSTDSLALKNYSNISNNNVAKWDSTNGQFIDSIMTEDTAATCINVAGSVTITDNLSVLGTFTCLDTNVSTSSALSVVNAGTGPALFVEQTGIGQPIAEFKDTEGGAMIIGDSGDVGIGIAGSDPGEKLTVSGNISGSGTLQIDGVATLGDSTADIPVINGCGLCFANGLPAGGGSETTVITLNPSGSFETDEIDSAVWGGCLVEYSDPGTVVNTVPKFSNTEGTIGSSNIVDSGTVVTIDSDTVIDAGHKLRVEASTTTYTEAATFTATVDSTETTVTTLPASNLKSIEYSVTLVNGVNVTTFKVNAVHNGTGECGTTYAIVDAQAASQLDSVEISSTGSTMDLDITAAADGTTAIIKAIGIYTS